MIEERETSLQFFEKRHNPKVLPYAIETIGPQKGPHLVIVGGTHGNEPLGVNAIIAYLNHFEVM